MITIGNPFGKPKDNHRENRKPMDTIRNPRKTVGKPKENHRITIGKTIWKPQEIA